jgi:hypothetical protein
MSLLNLLFIRMAEKYEFLRKSGIRIKTGSDWGGLHAGWMIFGA